MKVLLLLVLVAAVIFPCNGKLVSLAQKNVDKINIQTSRDILTQILETIEQTVTEQNVLSTNCETKINQTIESCTACTKDLCTPKPPQIHEQIFLGLVSKVNQPVIKAAQLVKDIGSKLNGLENLGVDFYRKLAKTTIFLKATLIEGGQQVFSGAISGLETVRSKIAEAAKKTIKNAGKWFSKLGGKFPSGFEGILGKFGGGAINFGSIIGNRLHNFGNDVANTGKKIGNGIVDTGKNIGNGIVDTGKSIGDAFKGVFGKRSTRHIVHKRCAKSCPMCDLLDTKKHTQDKIVEMICGADFLPQQNKAVAMLEDLEGIYNFILEQRNPVVTKFEFDEATGVFENGSLLFKKSFVTYTVGKASKRFRLSGNFDIADIDGMGVEISKQVRSRVF